jgi:hypothetical protein
VEKAADVLNYRKSQAGALRPLAYTTDGLVRAALVADARFVMERVQLDCVRKPLDLEGMPLAVLALDQAVECGSGDTSVLIAPYTSALLPASLGQVWFRAPDGAGTLLTAAPPSGPYALRNRLVAAGIECGAIAEFLAQFCS